MNAKILDCTLRDGGYVNNFEFGRSTIKSIVSCLASANIDIIECGFLSSEASNQDQTLFNSISALGDVMAPKKDGILYVAMIALGEKEISLSEISGHDETSIDGIRITFHEHEIDRAMVYASELMHKGYKVFMQPVGTTSYSDEGLIGLIQRMNGLEPYAFYIVDTLGTMYENDVLRLFHLVDHNLRPGIPIGFHSHNNLQLSFSNAQALLRLHSKRTVFIDSSVFGMGRGAGNLCTELLAQYINDNIERKYNVTPLLEIVDEHLAPISAKYTWGYSVPYYLAATNNCHPNYATNLLNKQTITVKQISELLGRIPAPRRALYNKALIEDIYVSYQKHSVQDGRAMKEIAAIVSGRSVLVLGPGRSIETQRSDIGTFMDRNRPCVISVNFMPDGHKWDLAFFSNVKRFNNAFESEIRNDPGKPVVITSNISTDASNNFFVVNYESLLNKSEEVRDNAGLMAMELLSRLGIKELSLAGFDGFCENRNENYYQERLVNSADAEKLVAMSKAIGEAISLYAKKMRIHFVTDSVYSQHMG